MNEILKIYEQKCRNNSDINEHLPVLRDYALKCDVIVELGVRSIVSTWAFLAATPKKLISVDIIHPSNYINHDPYGCNIELVNKLSEENGIKFQFIESNSITANIPECDMIFFDTLHTYNQLKAELSAHSHKSKKYLIFHDTVSFADKGEINGEEGIAKCITEFLNSNADWKVDKILTNNNGLTILKKVVPSII